MFGYVTVHKDELKIKDYNRYRAFYCGVCRSLKKCYGMAGQMTLTYDMTFLAILLSALYEDETEPVLKKCVPHPVKKHPEISNEYSDYAAGMNILLSYYKLKDNWDDERSVKSNAAAGLLKRAFKKACRKYPNQAKAVRDYIKKQHDCENENVTDIDEISYPTGEVLGQLFNMKNDEWKESLVQMGFYLGKFIYVLDAYDDLEKDIKKKNFNPLISMSEREDFNEYCKSILMTYAAEGARYFERLPILNNADILRNIIYAGIWSRFNYLNTEKEK